jgi:hypothetical protein
MSGFQLWVENKCQLLRQFNGTVQQFKSRERFL